MRFAIACGLVLSLSVPLTAQTQFRADLSGGPVVPPVSTNAGAYASLVLNGDNTVTYTVKSWLVSGTGASIHTGAVGANGPLLATLSGGPNIWTGTTAALAPGDRTSLRTRGLYVEIDTVANPAGEIRGQIEPRPVMFGAHLTGDQENPTVVTSALGDSTFIVNNDNTITYNVMTTGLSGTACHIHTGAFGVGGGVLFGLSGGPTVWSGTTVAMNATQFSTLQASGLYVNVHTIANPNGEIRGQIVPTEIAYGVGRSSTVGMPTFHAGGAAMRGGTLTLNIAGGLPSGNGLLIMSLSDGVATNNLCPYLLGAPLLILPLPLGAGGTQTIAGSLPDLPSSINIFMQYFGIDPALTNGTLYATNGLLIPIFDY